MEKEKFKDIIIPGYLPAGYYQVSNMGRVKSLKRKVKHWRGGDLTIKEKMLTATVGMRGYSKVDIAYKGKTKYSVIHRLVANAFIENPENKPEVNHKNGIKTDNRVENLEWVTSSENQRHAFKVGLHVTKKGEEHYNSKLNKIQVRIIRKLRGSITQKEIGKYFGVSHITVSNIMNNQTWVNT